MKKENKLYRKMKEKELKFILEEGKEQFIKSKELLDLKGIVLSQKWDIPILIWGNNDLVFIYQECYILNLSIKSFVLNTSTLDCSFSLLSPDQIGQLNESATAKYGMSFLCGQTSFASFNLPMNSASGIGLILVLINSTNSSNSESESPVFDLILGRLLSNSLNNSFGAIKENLSVNNISAFFVDLPLAFDMIVDNISFASDISSTYNNSGYFCFNLLNIPSLILSDSSLASFSVSLDLETSALNFSNASLVFCSSINLSLANSERLTHGNFDISLINFSSTAKVIDAIYITPLDFNFSNFLRSSIFSIIALRTTSAGFTSGNSSLNLFNNSSGTDTVILGILISPHIYLNTSNYLYIKVSFLFTVIFKRPDLQKESYEQRFHGKIEKVTENQKLILESTKKNSLITPIELSKIVNISRKIKENLSKIKEKGILKRIGHDKGGYWEVVET